MARIDVIMPFYNTNIKYVQAALQSILLQTYHDWKAIIVNDGSCASSTREIEELLASHSDRRLVYVKTKNQGPAGARNVGISKSDATYISFLDSDDRWYPTKLEQQIQLLERNPHISLVHSHYEVIDASGSIIALPTAKDFLNQMPPEQLFIQMLKENFVATSTVLLCRSAGEAVGFFDETFDCPSVEDKELWLRLLSAGFAFLYHSKIVTQYRRHMKSTAKKVENWKRMRLRLIEKIDIGIESNTLLQIRNWQKIRKHMLYHAFQEMSEEYCEQKNYCKALRYSLPCYSGYSSKAFLLLCRALFGFFFKLNFLHQMLKLF